MKILLIGDNGAITRDTADAVGTKANIAYIPSRDLTLVMPSAPHRITYGVIMCSKRYSQTFDNTKTRSAVPEYECKISLKEGLD